MAKPVATLEAVSAAADVLAASGVEPSLTLVQERTGGSYTTVKRHLEAWRAKREDEAAAVDVPADVLLRGSALARELYTNALRLAEANAAQPLNEAIRALKRAEGQVAVAEAEVARLEDSEQAQAEHVDRLEMRARELELSAAVQLATIRDKTEAFARIESQLSELQAKHQQSLEELAALRASTTTTEALHGQLETIQRSVQGLAELSGRRTTGG